MTVLRMRLGMLLINIKRTTKKNHIDSDKKRTIRLYKNEKNLGMSGNWNHSLELCTGKYLKLVCADDLMDPNLIETVYDKIGGFDPSFVFIVDYDFYMRIYCSGKVYILHDKPLNYFRIRNDSNTGQVLGGGKTKTYVAEHRHLMEKAAPVIGLSKFQITISVFIRRIMCVLGALYLKLNVPKE